MGKFRLKIVISFLFLLLLFLGGMLPLVTRSVHKIVVESMSDRADELIATLQRAPDEPGLILALKGQKPHIFFRAGLLNSHGELLYDSHTKRLLKHDTSTPPSTTPPEVVEALQEGLGFAEGHSSLLNLDLVYLAKRFSFHGNTYVLRLAFPQEYMQPIRKNFELGFLIFASLMLLLFSALTGLLLFHLMAPFRQIVQAIKPYQEGRSNVVPQITLKTYLKDEFFQFAQTVNSLSSAISTHIESQKAFVANASHELKTPITIIRGFAETLYDHPTLDPATIRDVTAKIVRNCTRMTTTITNLLTLASIEHLPPSKLQPCDLKALAQHCRQTILATHPEAKLAIHAPPESLIIEANPDLLELALTNLLDNAAKYSASVPAIQLTLQKAKGHIEIAITDHGLGIPPQDLDHIFQRFYTVNKSHSRRLGGSGLGLSIVDTIIKKHFGKIGVQSTLGSGSTFTVSIPDDIPRRLYATNR